MNAFERMIEDDDDGRQETFRHQHGLYLHMPVSFALRITRAGILRYLRHLWRGPEGALLKASRGSPGPP